MLRVQHALTSGPLTTASLRRVPAAKRCRSQVAHKKRNAAKHASHDRFDPPGTSKHASQKSILANLWSNKAQLGFNQRTQLVDENSFILWLEQHLKMLITRYESGSVIQRPEEEGFATFLRNLMPVLKSDSIQRALNIKEEKKLKSRTKWQPLEQSRPTSLFTALKEAFAENGGGGVDNQLRYSYMGLLAGRSFSKIDLEDQARLVDLRYPTEWYPATRELQRSIHLHVGPTNSGKTYNALKRLEQAKTGVYAGPLRLLAHEVYTRLNAQGKTCDLITGDEQRINTSADGPRMISCTVEMVPLNTRVDVAVIDEIQMIGDESRGWAWTQALLGLQAKEIHLCGEARTVPLIRDLAASMGDSLEVHTYERLSPLKTMSTSLRGDLKNLRKGDCVVVFSRVGIHAMKSQVERMTGKRAAIVYGSLPPEVRAQQAALFNDPHNDYDILVASDAIGMGLNLAIKRIVFETVTKFNGTYVEAMHPSHIKQIAGRAGRYRTTDHAQKPEKLNTNCENATSRTLFDLPAPPANIGLVTTLEARDLSAVRDAMQTEPEPIMTAGLITPWPILQDFARYFPPSINFSYVLLRLQELARVGPRYHLCLFKDQISIADAIHPVVGLSAHDRNIICESPARIKDPDMQAIVVAYARCIERNCNGELLSIPEIPLEVLDEEVRLDREYIRRLETLHKALVLYIWLSYRFAGVFLDQDMAFHVKKLTEEKIDTVLGDFSASPAVHKRIQALKREALHQVQMQEEAEEKPQDQSNRQDLQEEEYLSILLEGETSNKEDQSSGHEVPKIDPGFEDEREPPAVGSMVQ